MRILFVSAEVAPFVSVGGLSQVMMFLPKALAKMGHDVRIFTAKYGSMYKTEKREKDWKLNMELEGLKVPVDDNDRQAAVLICNVKSFPAKRNNVYTYFLENREYYELRANVFGYKDDHVRFALLSKGVLEWLYSKWNKNKPEGWWPEIIHCNDWHTAYLINMARTIPRYRTMLKKTPIVYTVHNFAYQGNSEFRYQDPKDKDEGKGPVAPLLDDALIKQNALMRGIIYADAVTTVSPTHAIEVLRPEYAEGLEETLLEARGKLSGILNGLDTHEFNPETDPLIYKNFSSTSFIHARAENKAQLQRLFQLPQNPKAPLIGNVGRICFQKGWDILLQILPNLFKSYPNLQMIVLGGGDNNYREQLLAIQRDFPNQLALHLRPDFRLPRKIFAGVDIMLMPSMFEPGGIVAMESLRYGAVPIVRRTGGLNDIVTDFNPGILKGNGFSFKTKESLDLFVAIVKALTIFEMPKTWQHLVKNCLECDYSWDKVARLYTNWYTRIEIEKRRETSETPHPAYNTILPAVNTND